MSAPDNAGKRLRALALLEQYRNAGRESKSVTSVTEKDLRCSILKVVKPYEGTAFVAAPNLALSCVHVCVEDGASSEEEQPVELAYRAGSGGLALTLHGRFLPDQSDPAHDVAVVQLAPPGALTIPPVPLSLDSQPKEAVVAVGYPEGQSSLEHVAGVVLDKFPVRTVAFEGGFALEVLQISTSGNSGFWSELETRRGMSGGPVWNELTGTVVAIVEGKRPRGDMNPALGYAIELKHLKGCSLRLSELILTCQMDCERAMYLVEASKDRNKRLRVIERLLDAIRVSSSDSRHWCYLALGMIGGKEAVAALNDGLADEDEFARSGAVEGMELLRSGRLSF